MHDQHVESLAKKLRKATVDPKKHKADKNVKDKNAKEKNVKDKNAKNKNKATKGMSGADANRNTNAKKKAGVW